jgi:branched-chain amino acid transport system substrate-binding protein
VKALVEGLWGVGMKKIAVAYQDDAFGATVLAGVTEALQKHGTLAVVAAAFPRNSANLTDVVAKVRQAEPEAVVMAALPAALADFVKRSHAAGWRPLVCAPSAAGPEPFSKLAGADAEGTVISAVIPPYTREDLPTATLYGKLLKKYAPAEEPNFISLEGMVDAMVVVEGLKRAGRDLTRTKFIKALESIHDLDLGLGRKFRLTYGPQRHKGFDEITFTVIQGGRPIAFTDWRRVRKP